jgi:DNA recombination protein RmuC
LNTTLTEKDVFILIAGLAAGAAAGWLLARTRWLSESAQQQAQLQALEATLSELRREAEEKSQELERLRELAQGEAQARSEAQTRLEFTQKQLEEEKKLLAEATARLSDAFKALSADALQRNNQTFLELARQAFQNLLSEAKGELGRKEQAVEALVRPLSEALQRYEGYVKSLEENRQKAYGGLLEQLRALTSVSEELRRETHQLMTAFRTPQVRGKWGELTLRRVAELAGMSPYCDYTEQMSAEGEASRLRPDMIIHLPSGREIVVDAKLPLDGYLDSLCSKTEEARTEALARHARQVKDHVRLLSEKAYWQQFPKSPEFVVLFVPNDAVLCAALEMDRDLLEDAIAQRVILATPATLIALLRAIAFGWRQEELARNARKISELGRQLHDRLKTLVEHFSDLGKAVGRVVDSFNRAVGSLESRVLPAARRFQELGAAGGDSIPDLPPVTEVPREITEIPEEGP